MTSSVSVDAPSTVAADTPTTPASFRELGVSNAAAGALERRGYTHPLPVQAMVLPDILEGRDILAKSPTGSGKTLAFMVPLLDSLDANKGARPQALILAPTRELASQIVEESREIAHALALRITAVYGGVGLQKQARDGARSHVIVATPGRLEDLLQRRAFDLREIEILVLDEADRMLDMGFKPAIDRIVGLCPDERQTLFFSATLDGDAGKIAQEFTVDAATHVHAPPTRPITEMDHRFIDTHGDDKVDLLVDTLESEERGLAIVFVRTKHGADRLARRLDQAGVDSGAMHGGKTQNQRERALRAFERGQINVLVATDVAARGIDIDDITHVINYDAPEDREAYVHRIGRTGRAGRDGIGITFVAPGQEGEVAAIVRELGLEDRFAEGGLNPDARFTGKKSKKKNGGGGGGFGGQGGRGGQQSRGPRGQQGGGRSQGRGGYGSRDDRPQGGGGYGSRDDRPPRSGGYGRDNRTGFTENGDRGGRGHSDSRGGSRPDSYRDRGQGDARSGERGGFREDRGGRSHGGGGYGGQSRAPQSRENSRHAGAQGFGGGGARPGKKRSGSTSSNRSGGGAPHGGGRQHDGGQRRSGGNYSR